MAERSFKKEVEALRLGAGDTFHGEGILAVTKALLEAGVSYVGGYQGAPVSHMMDVLEDAQPILDELGVHYEGNASEAAAAAMLGASINYPMRGAVTWKSTVGTNVASDALSNLASAGVKGGALIILGEDYGDGASIIQERTHAFAMKSQMWLLDPRPNLPTIVRMVEKGFELSEASSTPVMLELRIRACHVHGSFSTRDNVSPAISRNNVLENADFDFERICLPPSTYVQERLKIDVRMPAAIAYVRDQKLNEVFDGDLEDLGIIMQGGMYNSVMRSLSQLGLADAFGKSRIPLYVLNVTYPLVPDEISGFCAGKRAVLIVEEGQPDYLEQAIHAVLRRADVNTKLHGKDVLPMAGEYTGEVMLRGIAKFAGLVGHATAAFAATGKTIDDLDKIKSRAREILGHAVPARPPGFCVGCPERPVFSAMKLAKKELGEFHVSSDIGCHTFSTLAPFNIGNTVLGYGLSLASSTAIGPNFGKRVVSVMGDGGLWHNGLTSGVAESVFNKNDGVLIVMDNGYTSATGAQHIPSSRSAERDDSHTRVSIEDTMRGFGVKWVRTVRTYSIEKMMDTLKEAMTTKETGLKVIVAAGECMLAVQRRLKPLNRAKIARGGRVVQPRFGVDAEVCTGDHSCIRLSGCPSLTIKPNPDPLRDDPVAHVDNSCVGCGVCGEVSHAAVLCPSFYKAEIVHNPTILDRVLFGVRRTIISALRRLGGAPVAPAPAE
ncbi:MAG: indolepyruvate ferredoxin oxidoreductase subunit alpha [Proteobacteria bacterium]|nr:indolepyruvate ferredoxin oxidoreductase subunit alpha [Pseudomonadota bacterium]